MLNMNHSQLEQEIGKMARAMMTRNSLIGKDLIADLRGRLSVESVAALMIVSIERLIWSDCESVIWSLTYLIPADTSIILKPIEPKDVLWSKVLSDNTLLQLSEKDILLSELNLKNIESKYFPYVRLNTGYGFSHFNYDIGTFDKQRNWGPNVGVTVGINLFNGFNTRREQKNAHTRIENRKLETDQTRLSLKSDFSNMWQAYRNNLELLGLEKENVEYARENYEIASERFKLGDLAGILLREAQNSLLAAEERLVDAQFNIKLNEIALLQISGMITDYLR